MGDIVGIFGIFGSLYTFSKNTWAWNVKRDLETLFQPLCQSRRQSTSSYTRENLSYGSVFLETAESVGGVVYDSMIFFEECSTIFPSFSLKFGTILELFEQFGLKRRSSIFSNLFESRENFVNSHIRSNDIHKLSYEPCPFKAKLC